MKRAGESTIRNVLNWQLKNADNRAEGVSKADVDILPLIKRGRNLKYGHGNHRFPRHQANYKGASSNNLRLSEIRLLKECDLG